MHREGEDMKKKYIFSITVAALMAAFMTGCIEQAKLAREQLEQSENPNIAKVQIFAMDTIMNMTIENENGDELLKEATQKIHNLESLFSVTQQDSDIYKLNHSAGENSVNIALETADVLQNAKEISQITNGAYNTTISPIVKLWGFTEDEHHVPTKNELQKLLPNVNMDYLELESNDSNEWTAFLQKSDMAVDLGGIAKGYTSDYLTKWLKDQGVESGYLSLGGNVSAIGLRNNGEKWRIGIQDPLDSNELVGVLKIEDQSVITSGGYQRFFETDGKKYHHILDPSNGFPAESGLLSVTIISKNGTKADGLSTALFVMGLEQATALWRNSNDFEAVFVTKDQKVFVTEGLKDDFIFKGDKAGYVLKFISKNM